jgi:ribosomal protein S12 methylthiotransferase accessory factor
MSALPLRDLVSPKVGLIRSVGPQPRSPLEPVPPYLSIAMLSHFDFRAAPMSDRVAAGKGPTAAEAEAAAIGEAMERYCALQWDPSRTFVAPWSDVERGAISPSDLVLYSSEQYARPAFPFPPWDVTNEISWIRGVELPSGREVSLPAGFVYLVSPAPRPEDRLTAPTSNGLAAGSSLDRAVLGGLCELIERDAMLTCWLNRLPATELDTATAGPLVAHVVRHYRRQGVVVRAFVLPTDLPATVVMAIAFDDDPAQPAQVVGLGCHPDPAVAVEKATFELCQARPSEGKRFRDNPPTGRLERYEDVRTLNDHSAFASRRAGRDEFDFLLRAAGVVALDRLPSPVDGGPKELLAECVRRLTDDGHRVAYADLTLPDVAQAGIHVTRVLVTELQPIHFGHGFERLGGRRLFEVPRLLGLDHRTRAAADLNPCPHPLA